MADVFSSFMEQLRKRQAYDPLMGAAKGRELPPEARGEEQPIEMAAEVVEAAAPFEANPGRMLRLLSDSAGELPGRSDYRPAREGVISMMGKAGMSQVARPDLSAISQKIEAASEDGDSPEDRRMKLFFAVIPAIAGGLLGGLPGAAGAAKGAATDMVDQRKEAIGRRSRKLEGLKSAASSQVSLYKADQDALTNRFKMLGELDEKLAKLDDGSPEFKSLMKSREAYAQAAAQMAKELGMGQFKTEQDVFKEGMKDQLDDEDRTDQQTFELEKMQRQYELRADELEKAGMRDEAKQARQFANQLELEKMRQAGMDRRLKMKPAAAAKAAQPKEPKLTEAQSKAALYARTMNSEIDALENFENDPSFLGRSASSLTERLAPDFIANFYRTPEYRQYLTAGKRFLASALRQETGAAVTDAEVDLYMPMYLAMPGDDAATVRQKAARRKEYARSLQMLAGAAGQMLDQNIGAPMTTQQVRDLEPKPEPITPLPPDVRKKVDEAKERLKRQMVK